MPCRSSYREELLAVVLVASLCGCTPHQVAAGPSIAYGQWTASDLSYDRCMQRAPGALRTEGYAASRTFRGWFGNAGPTSATIVCYGLGKGSVVTINVASDTSLEVANSSLGRLAFQVFGTTPSSCTSPVGTWVWPAGRVIKVNADSTQTGSSGESGSWQALSGGRYHFHWTTDNSDDYAKLSDDGNSMTGTFNGIARTINRKSHC